MEQRKVGRPDGAAAAAAFPVERAIEQLAAIVESSRDAIITKALDGTILTWNRAAEEMYGYTSAEAVGKPIWIVVPDDRTDEVWDILERIGRDERVSSYETVRRRKDGTLIEVSVSVSPVHDRGEIVSAAVIARDISERKREEADMIAAQKLESLGVLAGGIAHEFNNLLLSVLGNADILRRGLPASSPLLRNLTGIETAGTRAAELTNQMLSFSGQGRYVVEPIDIGAFLQEIESLLHAAIPKTVALQFNIAPELSIVEADRSQMTQLVMNLITNAAEAIGEDKGTIQVELSAIDASADYLADFEWSDALKPAHYVVLEVTDTGCGMDDTTKGRIFEPFFSTKFHGRGLGLAATLGIIRAHRGASRLVTNHGHGSTFTVILRASCPTL